MSKSIYLYDLSKILSLTEKHRMRQYGWVFCRIEFLVYVERMSKLFNFFSSHSVHTMILCAPNVTRIIIFTYYAKWWRIPE